MCIFTFFYSLAQTNCNVHLCVGDFKWFKHYQEGAVIFLTWAFIDRSYSITYFGFSASKLICINWPFLLVSVSLKLLLVRASCRNLSLPPLSATILPPDWQTTSLLVTSQATTAYCLVQSFFYHNFLCFSKGIQLWSIFVTKEAYCATVMLVLATYINYEWKHSYCWDGVFIIWVQVFVLWWDSMSCPDYQTACNIVLHQWPKLQAVIQETTFINSYFCSL